MFFYRINVLPCLNSDLIVSELEDILGRNGIQEVVLFQADLGRQAMLRNLNIKVKIFINAWLQLDQK